MDSGSGPLAAVRAAVAGRGRGPKAIATAVGALAVSQNVFESLLNELCAAIVERPSPEVEGWQRALLFYLPRAGLLESQLRSWRWSVLDFGRSASLEVVPWMLHRTRERIRELHMSQLAALENGYENEFQNDEYVTDEGYMDGLGDLAQEAYDAFADSMEQRDRLLRPLLQCAVQAGAACLPLAEARKLDAEREASWGGAGAGWADSWAPEPAAHAAFHPRFRTAVRALLLASNRGLPGTVLDRGPIHLPTPVLHKIVGAMAGREMEADWVPLAEVPAWVDLNSTI